MSSDTLVLFVAHASGRKPDPSRFTYDIQLKGYGLTAAQARRNVRVRRKGDRIVVYSVTVKNAAHVSDVATCLRDVADVAIALDRDPSDVDPRCVVRHLRERYAA